MALRLRGIAPNFIHKSTAGDIDFHAWLDTSWGLLFSHPKDFTPVCTTELGTTAKLKDEFARRNVKALAVSVDALDSCSQRGYDAVSDWMPARVHALNIIAMTLEEAGHSSTIQQSPSRYNGTDLRR